MSAMPVMIGVLCVMAIAYRYYSAFLAARVATLDDLRETPAVKLNDGQNYHPTNKWVLFGHHFAAISGAGPLIGPVLAAQFGYLPGLLWIVIGVCLGGAVQDFLVLVASTRRGGKSLAQIAYSDIGRTAGAAATAAVLFIIIIALAGLGKVVVKALGGEDVAYKASKIVLPQGAPAPQPAPDGAEHLLYQIPPGTTLSWGKPVAAGGGAEYVETQRMAFKEGYKLQVPAATPLAFDATGTAAHPAGAVRLNPGSSWGTFTIACTIPIALFVGLYMYRLRKGKVVEASLIGGALTLVATVLGGYVANHAVGQYFNLTAMQVTLAMAAYGFVASVLPVWVLLCPRDYLSSFLKIGTIGLLVIGTLVANPKLEAPAYNAVFAGGGPTVGGTIFPFLFITVMCGAISGFHALVSSGTTPKMIAREGHMRVIGYGSMLIEGLVAVVAMIAAAALPVGDYYAMNTELANVPAYQDRILQIPGGGIEHVADYEDRTQESLRGRTGGAVTLAVGFAHIFDGVARKVTSAGEGTMRALWSYWFHFAIMFEALFILTTIDTGTRIGRFLFQEVAGKVHPKLGRTDWWPGAVVSTAVVVAGWAYFMNSDSFSTIWKMFGIGNQTLAVIALAIVTAFLAREGKRRYVWVTLAPMAVIIVTTGSSAVVMLTNLVTGIRTQLGNPPGPARNTVLFNSTVQAVLIVAMVLTAAVVVASMAGRVWGRNRHGGPTAERATPEPVGAGR